MNDAHALFRRFGADDADLDDLTAYTTNAYQHPAEPLSLPLPDELFVPVWSRYAEARPLYPALRERLPQFRFAVAEGLSQSATYKATMNQGAPVPADQPPVELEQPDALRLEIHPTAAGRVPVLISSHRPDFVTLVRVLGGRGEPVPVPDSMGATMISGLVNWDRLGKLKADFMAANPGTAGLFGWGAEFKRLSADKGLYQDRVMILSEGNYSGVPASALGLDPAEWRRLSLIIRREHESAHYFTRRVLNSMRNNIYDELIADTAGIMAAAGCYRADWARHFLGLENFPAVRADGRLNNYRGNPPISERAFAVVPPLVNRAIDTIERVTAPLDAATDIPRIILALARLRLEDLAADDADARFAGVYNR